jgi:murein DD-endopeptidase MepM/ murein hydrolase activator NlpD
MLQRRPFCAGAAGGMFRIIKICVLIVLVAAGAAIAWYSFDQRSASDRNFADEVQRARVEAHRIQSDVVFYTASVVPSRQSFAALLGSIGISPSVAGRAIASAQRVFDLRHVRAGNRFSVGRSVMGELREIRYSIDADHMLRIAPDGADFHSDIATIPSSTEETGVAGEIRGSLFEGVTNAGEKPELAMRLAEIFGWDLDFYTDPRPGDTFRVVVEKKKLSTGELASYGKILAAEYVNHGHAYRAVLFHDPAGNPAYYTPDGKSMKKAFLHSPLKFAAPITSHFSNARFHPILKEYRPHLGIDYGAPSGTPVQTIGDGKVIFAGPKGGAGNLIQIKHTNGYETYYMHLSRILVRTGQRVEQGERIGLVGMTGLATGPHLDFRIENHGQFLNFEHLPLPPSDPVTKSDWAAFATARDHAVNLFPVPGTVVAQNPPAATAAPAQSSSTPSNP